MDGPECQAALECCGPEDEVYARWNLALRPTPRSVPQLSHWNRIWPEKRHSVLGRYVEFPNLLVARPYGKCLILNSYTLNMIILSQERDISWEVKVAEESW